MAFDPWGRPLGRLRSVDDGPADDIYNESGEFLLVPIDISTVTFVRRMRRADIQRNQGANPIGVPEAH